MQFDIVAVGRLPQCTLARGRVRCMVSKTAGQVCAAIKSVKLSGAAQRPAP